MAEAPLRRRVHLGLELDEVPGRGLGVSAVAPSSTAALAGIEPGDLLVEIAGTPVWSADRLFAVVREVQVGSVVSLTVEREGTRHTLEGPGAPLPLERLPSGLIELDEFTTPSGRRRVIRSVPEGEGPFAVVYLLQGASWSSCEFPLDPATPLLQLVSGLTAAGFATQRVERSGVGDSEGPTCREVGFESELSDYRVGLEHLRRWPGCQARAVFLLGVSLGGMVAPLIADAGVRGVAVIGSTALPISRATHGSAERSWRRAGVPEPELVERLALLLELEQLVYREKLTPEEAYLRRPELQREFQASYFRDRAFGRSVRFFQELDDVDLEAAWRALLCPALALHGEHDWVTTREDALALAALARAGCSAELAGVDHELRQAAGTDQAGAFAPAVLSAVVTFFDELRP